VRGRECSEGQWERRLLQYARQIAEQALEPDFFPVLAGMIREDFSPPAVAVLEYDGAGQLTDSRFIVQDRALATAYTEYFHTVNPYPGAVTRYGLENASTTFEAVLPRKELAKTEYWNDFLRPFDVPNILGLSVSLPEVGRISITAARSAADGKYNPSEVRRLDSLRPFLTSAIRLRSLVSSRAGGGVARVLSPTDALLARTNGKIDARNDAAEQMLTQAVGPIAQRVFDGDAALGRAIGMDLQPPFAGCAGARACALRVQQDDSARDEELRVRYGLSRREAQVARLLASGLAYKEIAAMLGISFHTASSHAKAVLHKLGVDSSRKIALLLR
jgi:DNA-binding CsgD family transcriptional regulator